MVYPVRYKFVEKDDYRTIRNREGLIICILDPLYDYCAMMIHAKNRYPIGWIRHNNLPSNQMRHVEVNLLGSTYVTLDMYLRDEL